MTPPAPDLGTPGVVHSLGRLVRGTYDALYALLAGTHPRLRVCHFQWLPGTILYRALRPVLAELRGDVLDVGCGEKPYGPWMAGVRSHVGVDVLPGPNVDILMPPSGLLPVPDDSFDAVLCTQVLEHVADLELTVGELIRVLRPAGKLVLTVPFIYPEHGSPHDYRRMTQHELPGLLGARMQLIDVVPQGGLGSTLGTLFLGWLYLTLGSGPRILLLTALLPLWLIVAAVVNCVCWFLDRLDQTGLFYGNVLAVAVKLPHDSLIAPAVQRPLIDASR